MVHWDALSEESEFMCFAVHDLPQLAMCSRVSILCSILALGRFRGDCNFLCGEIAKHLALPPAKLHCSVLAEDAVVAAVKDYEAKHAKSNGGPDANPKAVDA